MTAAAMHSSRHAAPVAPAQPQRGSRSGREAPPDDQRPDSWRGNTALLRLDDPQLRLRVQSLLLMRATEPEKLVAIQVFVKSLEFSIPRERMLNACQVVQGRGNGWFGKSTLFVALLRIAGFPARVRLLQFVQALFRGFLETDGPFCLPIVEMWTRWVRTDSHIYDPEYLTLTRRALLRRGWVEGFGTHRYGTAAWNGREESMIMAGSTQVGGTSIVADFGAFNDPEEFMPVLIERNAAWFGQRSRFYWRKSRLRRGLKRLRAGDFDTR